VGGRLVTLFLCGDVMLGRGVDQILPYPGDPALRERFVTDARRYVELAELANGPIPAPVDFFWPWGDVLDVLDEAAPDVRIVNLETAITRARGFASGKGIHYRMNPANLASLAAARPDACVIANNHILDFGREGLSDTVEALGRARIPAVGAGRDRTEAWTPVCAAVEGAARVLVLAVATQCSGVPASWAATDDRAGVAYVPDLSAAAVAEIADRVRDVKQGGDIVIVSIHWGANWGYDVSADQIAFAHEVIDAGADVLHGHSSHHPRPIEIYRGKLILYGCGDLINDYEGIGGHSAYRPDLRLAYVAVLDPGTGELITARLAPMAARQMRLWHASIDDCHWLRAILDRISVGCRIRAEPGGQLVVTPGGTRS
jgi:poly-gamma-glutamate synthesis protein (capsule biosynthesis protein)